MTKFSNPRYGPIIRVRNVMSCIALLCCVHSGCQDKGPPTPSLARTLDEKRQLAGHKGKVWALALSSDGKLLASGSADRAIRLWDFESGKLLGTLAAHQDEVTGLAFDPRGRWLASASLDKTVRIWNLEKQTERQVLGDGKTPFRLIRYSLDGKYLVASGAKVLHIWEASSDSPAKVHRRIEDDYLRPGYLDFIGQGKRIAVSYALGIGSWDVDAADAKDASFEYENFGEKNILWFVASRDGKLLAEFGASGDDEGRVKLWKLPAREESVKVEFIRRAFTGALSPNSGLLATSGRELPITLWSASSGKQVAASKGQEGDCFSLLFSNDGKKLISGGADGVIRVWEVPTSNR